MHGIKSFTDLIAWQKAQVLVLEVYKASKKFPTDERFGLTNQIRRAVIAITSNVAEGFGRNTGKDKCQFYAIAHGSTIEVHSQLFAARDLGYISDVECRRLSGLLSEVARLIGGLNKSAMDRS